MWDLGQALGRVVAFNQSNQLQEIIDPEMRAPPGHHIERIWPSHIGPGRSNTPQAPTVIVKVDALLSPSATPFNQSKLLPIERMKRVRDSKNLIRIELIVCSWLLIRRARWRTPSGTPRPPRSRAGASRPLKSRTPSWSTGNRSGRPHASTAASAARCRPCSRRNAPTCSLCP